MFPLAPDVLAKLSFMFVCQTYRFHNAWKLMRLTQWILGVFVFQTPQSGPRVILIYIYICSLMAVLPKVGCSNLGYSFSYCYLLTIKSLAYFEWQLIWSYHLGYVQVVMNTLRTLLSLGVSSMYTSPIRTPHNTTAITLASYMLFI